MRYFRRPWDEDRGDEHSDWGTSTWYFEVRESGEVVRQIEVYANGTVLKYNESTVEDDYGGLATARLDIEDFVHYEILPCEFESVWTM